MAPDIGVVALADGMGGHRAGEIASHMAADLVVNGLRSHLADAGATAAQHSPLLAVDKSINQANRTILDAAGASRVARGHGHDAGRGALPRERRRRSRTSATRGSIGCAAAGSQLLTRDDSLLRQQVEAGLIGAERRRRFAQPQLRHAGARRRRRGRCAPARRRRDSAATCSCCAPTASTTSSTTTTSSSSCTRCRRTCRSPRRSSCRPRRTTAATTTCR